MTYFFLFKGDLESPIKEPESQKVGNCAWEELVDKVNSNIADQNQELIVVVTKSS